MLLAISLCLATIVGVPLIYVGSRAILQPESDADIKDLAGSILFRIAALHGLVLALVFAAEVVEYQQIELDIATEVNAVSDIYYDIGRYGVPETADGIRKHLREYLTLASTEEWEQLGQDRTLVGRAWGVWEQAYNSVLDLEPIDSRQEALRDNMLGNIGVIVEKRDLREYHAKTGLGFLFWSAAFLGVALVAAGYFTYPVNPTTIVLLSMFGGYTGFILFTIVAMSNPFSAPAAVEPLLFKDLLTEINSIAQ